MATRPLATCDFAKLAAGRSFFSSNASGSSRKREGWAAMRRARGGEARARRLAPALVFVFVFVFAAGCYPSPEYDLDRLGVPRFVSVNYIDLSGVTRISLFRSSYGHDYSDEAESCRSMKHYLGFPSEMAAVYAPVTGHVLVVDGGWAGVGITIQSLEHPAFQFTVFHVVLAAPMPTGTRVEAGTFLGRHVGTQTASDIAVEVNTPSGRRLVSYFETLTDEAFAPFQARGIASRADLIITRAQRDAAPLSCEGETFVSSSSDPYPQVVAF